MAGLAVLTIAVLVVAGVVGGVQFQKSLNFSASPRSRLPPKPKAPPTIKPKHNVELYLTELTSADTLNGICNSSVKKVSVFELK